MSEQRGLGAPDKIKILLYHRISDKGDDHWTVSSYRFRQQLEYLVRTNYTAISFQDYLLFEQGELNLPKRPIVLTFDDGYSDLHRHAFPLMREYGMKGVIFALGDRSIHRNTWDTDVEFTRHTLLSDEQILEMQEAEFEIGSHSLTHRRLTHLTKHEAWDEISRSRMALEMLLNSPVRSFSYPFGLVNSGVKSLVQEAGYRIGCSAWSGPLTFGADLLENRRILVRGGIGLAAFAASLTLPYRAYRWMVWKLKHRPGPRLHRYVEQPNGLVSPEQI